MKRNGFFLVLALLLPALAAQAEETADGVQDLHTEIPAPVADAPPAPGPNAASGGDADADAAPDDALGPHLWPNPTKKLAQTSLGAVDACETVAFPLTFLPGIGSLASSLIEWVCLVPAALAIDYVAVHHAGYESFLWPPLVALLLAKLYRGVVLVAGITAIAATAVVYTTAITTMLLVAGAGHYIPVGLTGVISLIGGLILGMRVIERVGSELVFLATYTNLANELSDPQETARAQEQAFVKPPLDAFSRGYALLAAAAGASPERHWSFGIPLLGPLFHAGARAEAVEDALLLVGRDVLHETPQHPDLMRATAQVTSYAEGALTAAGQALLTIGGGIFVAGTVVAALAYQSNEDLVEYGAWLGGLGAVGVAIATGGVLCVLARQIPRVARSLLAPAAFGLLPPEEAAAVE